MNKKFIIILVVLVLVFIIGGGVLAWVFLKETRTETLTNRKTNTSQTRTNGTSTGNSSTGGGANTSTGGGTTTQQNSEEQEISALAKSFMERFGTFSNENNFENINNIRVYMTNKMTTYSDELIRDAEEDRKEAAVYYGITTRALSIQILQNEGNQAKAQVTTQRKESKGDTAEMKVYYQDVEVMLKQEAGTWKVDSVKWL